MHFSIKCKSHNKLLIQDSKFDFDLPFSRDPFKFQFEFNTMQQKIGACINVH